MNSNEISINELINNKGIELTVVDDQEIGDNHLFTSIETPLREDAFQLSDKEKIQKIEFHFREIMTTLGLDLNDDSLKGTPKRVAKMYVEEIFSGLNPENKPCVALFENKYKYDQMLVEKNISFYSNCEHHFVPIIGKAHLAYISSGKVIGLSKLNRIVEHFGRRGAIQEQLTAAIHQAVNKVCEGNLGVVVTVVAGHNCVSCRGVKHQGAAMITTKASGVFMENDNQARKEFFDSLKINNGGHQI
jgi:GTP cyclohydrolase I